MSIDKLYDILLSDKPSIKIKKHEKDLFKLIPELKKCKNFNQNNPWHIYDVYSHILMVVDNVPKDKELRIAALFHDLGKPETYTVDSNGIGHFYNHWTISQKIFLEFANNNNLDEELKENVSKLIFYHDINVEKYSDIKLTEFKEKFSKELLIKLFELKKADLLAQNPKYHFLLGNYDLQKNKILLKYK